MVEFVRRRKKNGRNAFRTGAKIHFSQKNIFLEYTHEVISTIIYLNICRTKPFKVDLTEILKRKFIPAILFCLDHPFCFALFLRE